jgi:hypothetical protein
MDKLETCPVFPWGEQKLGKVLATHRHTKQSGMGSKTVLYLLCEDDEGVTYIMKTEHVAWSLSLTHNQRNQGYVEGLWEGIKQGATP